MIIYIYTVYSNDSISSDNKNVSYMIEFSYLNLLFLLLPIGNDKYNCAI